MSSSVDLRDREARRKAAAEFDRPLALEAGAGSGKTTTLARRIVAWLLGPGWERAAGELAGRGDTPALEEIGSQAVAGVVALTFSEKAAQEMVDRVLEILSGLEAALARPEATLESLATEPEWEWLPAIPEPEARRRVRVLLARLDALALRTIHSFCLGLLARHPFEARLHPGFTIDADGRVARETAFEVLAERLPEAYRAGGTSPLSRLAGAGVAGPRLAQALERALAAGLVGDDFAGDPFDAGATERLIGRLRAALADLRAVLPAPESVPRAARTLRALGSALPAFEEVLMRAGADVGALSPLLDGDPSAAATLAKFADREPDRVGAAERDAYTVDPAQVLARAEVLSALVTHALELDPEGWRSARDAFAPLLAETRERLRRRGAVGFQDLLTAADRLLGDDAVASRERRRIRQLLVDEFQDTDEVQCRLLSRLAFGGTPGERPGLFVVGDPKQSIYGWRSARLDAYEAFLDELVRQGGEVERLTVNFRSDRPLLDEVNAVLPRRMRAERGFQPEYVALDPGPRAGDGSAVRAGGRAPVELWTSATAAALRGETRFTSAGEAMRLEAAAIGRDLVARREATGCAWSEFALLFRSGDVDDYLRALREAGVPFVVEKDRSYFRRREIIDAAALVRAVLDPADGVAFLAFLRAPFVGVPDAALLPFWRAGLPQLVAGLEGPDEAALAELRARLADIAGALPAGVPGLARIAGWEASAAAALEGLAHARRAARELPADRLVETLRRLFLPEVSAAGRFLGAFGLANLDRFFRELTGDLDASAGDPYAVLRELRRRLEEEPEAAESRPPGTAEDAVRVLTVHGAKGLEFGEVYLPALARSGLRGGPDGELVAERLDGRLEHRLFGLATPGFDRVLDRRLRLEEHEAVRLLYVAMTRARRRLVLIGNGRARGRAAGSTWAGLIEAWEALGRAPERRIAELATAGAAAAEIAGVRLFLPALEPPTAAAASPAVESAEALPDPESIAVASRSLLLRRVDATLRAARPRLLRASHLAAFEPDPADGQWERGPGLSAAEASGRDAARARGVALHRALELESIAGRDAGRWHAAVRSTYLAERQTPDPGELAELDAALERLQSSHLWKQSSALGERVVARELPLLLASDPEAESDGVVAGAEVPTDGYVGALDLVYRDAGSGELVVADFKSDAVAEAADVEAKVELYAPQLRLYGRAVRAALGLAYRPRLELWLLAADRIVSVD